MNSVTFNGAAAVDIDELEEVLEEWLDKLRQMKSFAMNGARALPNGRRPGPKPGGKRRGRPPGSGVKTAAKKTGRKRGRPAAKKATKKRATKRISPASPTTA